MSTPPSPQRTRPVPAPYAAAADGDTLTRLLTERLPVVLFAVDADGTPTAMHGAPARTQAVLAALGVGRDAPVEALADALARARRGERGGALVPGPDGMLEVHLEPDGDGRIVGLAVEPARTADARSVSSGDPALTGIFTQSLAGVYVIQDERFVLVNPRFASLFGYDAAEEVYALPSAEALVHEEDRARVMGNLRARAAGGDAPVHHAFRARRRDGSVLHVEVFGSRCEHDGRPAVVGTLLDATERVLARRALSESEERFRALVEHSTDLIAILEADGGIRYASPSHARVLGVAPERVTGRRIDGDEFVRHVHPDDVEVGLAAFAAALRDGSAHSERPVRLRHADGSWRALSVVFTDMRDNPAVRGVVANSRDVTEQRTLETQLREVQKLEAVGRLAGGVAHDFNNILAAISGYAQLLRESLAPNDPRRADVDEILSASNRGAGVTRQLLAFSRRRALETEVLDLATVVRELGRMLRPLLPASIGLELPPTRRSVHVRAVRTQIEQIVMNLAVNARDAMPTGGRLALDVDTRVAPGGAVRAVLAVRDDGVGMSAEVRDRIFEPFFTTKGVGQGTGLGLATVFGLVRQFGGTIDVESAPGEGTTFAVSFPAVPPPRDSGPSDAEVVIGLAPRASRRVLVVEDEPQVREVARRLLAHAGYTVVDAANGAEALARLEAGEVVDLVLTDAAMPVMSGWELAERLAARADALPVVLMSGYAELSGGAVLRATGIRAFLEKPFSGSRLLEVIGDVLAG